jgi:hypothetical protein
VQCRAQLLHPWFVVACCPRLARWWEGEASGIAWLSYSCVLGPSGLGA